MRCSLGISFAAGRRADLAKGSVELHEALNHIYQHSLLNFLWGRQLVR